MTPSELNRAITHLRHQLDTFELDPDGYTDSYEEALDMDQEVVIGGCTYYPSQILKALDETHYRTGLVDYVDGLDKEEDPKYRELQEELEALETELTANEGA